MIVTQMIVILQDTLHQCQDDIRTIDLECHPGCILAQTMVIDILHHHYQIVIPAVEDHLQTILMIDTTQIRITLSEQVTDTHKALPTECLVWIVTLHLPVQ